MRILSKKNTTLHFNQKWWSNIKVNSRYKNIYTDLWSSLNGLNAQKKTKPIK